MEDKVIGTRHVADLLLNHFTGLLYLWQALVWWE